MISAYWLIFFAILLLIVLSGFFSGSETALTAASRARMHQYEKNGDTRAGIVMKLLERQDQLIGTLLIGNNIVNILASALATSLFLKLFGEAGVAVATLVMTLLVVIFAEVMPKSFALSYADKFAVSVAPVVRILVIVFSPFAVAVGWIVRRLLRQLGVDIDSGASLLTGHEELRGAVEVLHRDGSVVKDDRDRLGGILDLHELEISDVMIHRTNMETINLDDSPEQIVKQLLDSPFTRIPLWQGDSDNIVGVIHSKDVLRALATKKSDISQVDIKRIASKPWFVPETTTLKDQLDAFLREKAHFALVVDEYGEVEGLVTLEDILEEIVGDIADEHDEAVSGVEHQADGSWIVDGNVQLRDLNRALDWQLPDEEANTIAGLVIHAAQTIPEEKQAFTFFGKRFVILKREKNRITQLRIRNL
ncbi:MAG: HlyC/CorC family transporter [Rhizobiaceae bacterium]|jgi:Mg2+/Co2+ transporter CorB|nr:HlyC/CorC family transporter [Rhizobiaceae bacterium]